MADIYDLTPQEAILSGLLEPYSKELEEFLKDKNVRKYYPEYVELLNSIKNNTLSDIELGMCTKSITDMYYKMELAEMETNSEYIFPGHKLVLYPSIDVLKAGKIHLCVFSGARINKGSEHLKYNLFIQDLSAKCAYVLKQPLRAEIGNEHRFPNNIFELDDFEYRLNTAYERGDDDYYNIATNMGSNSLRLIKLRRKI